MSVANCAVHNSAYHVFEDRLILEQLCIVCMTVVCQVDLCPTLLTLVQKDFLPVTMPASCCSSVLWSAGVEPFCVHVLLSKKTARNMQSKQAASPDPCMQGWKRTQS
jgi:hypothetical protein